jgi:NAD(P)-dependent dehydrogenase (short-subunit alcohol dehydrogenase family)
MTTLFDLTGRAAIVTGGSRGLGLEIAEGLAEAGAALMLCARRDEWLAPAVAGLRARGFAVEGRRADVAAPADVQAVVDATVAAYGAVDILVNNAGVSWGTEPEDHPLDKWRRVLDVNLTGAFLCAQAAGREMLKRGHGRIINVASAAGMTAALETPHYAAYAASKAGVMGLTRELAASWGRHNVRVNAIAPGFFETRLTKGVLPTIRRRLDSATPLGRIGAPGEIKGVAVFLAADASNYVTGQVIVVDGGASIAR